MNAMLRSRYAACAWLIVLIATLAPAVTLADAPGVRGPDIAPVGDTDSSEWAAIRALPPITGVPSPGMDRPAAGEQAIGAGLPAARVYGQADQQSGATAAFALRALYPGNWVMDAGLGIVSGTIQSIEQTLLGFLSAVSGMPEPTQEAPFSIGCNSSHLSILFCTRPEYVLPPGDVILPIKESSSSREAEPEPLGKIASSLQTVWIALQPAALALLTIVFTVRLGRVVHAGPAAFQSEVKALLLPFLASCTLVAAAPGLLRILLLFFATINTTILSGNLIGFNSIEVPFITYMPSDIFGTLSLGPVLSLLALVLVLFIVIVVALIRLAKLIVLLAIAPLAGATLIDRSTAPLFGNWLSKVIELLLHQLGWSVAALIGSTILSTLVPSFVGRPSDTSAFIVHTIGTALVLLVMLCQQQLFNGVFLLVAGGTSTVMGGALNKAATVMTIREGFRRQPDTSRPAASPGSSGGNGNSGGGGGNGGGGGGSGGSTSTGAGTAKIPASHTLPPQAYAPAPRIWHSGGATSSTLSGQPGARARASVWGRNGGLAQRMSGMPVQRARGAPPQPTAAPALPAAPVAPAIALASVATGSYIAAGRARRRASTVAQASPDRAATLRRLQAQAQQSGRQAWRAAPATLVREARWGAINPSSVAGQRALRELKQRPFPTRSERLAALPDSR